jgi:transcriptional regulator with XRE-family HTH domain
MPLVPSYGTRLRALRKARRLTQYQLAHASGVAQGLISRYESGKLVPEAANAQALDAALGRPVADFAPPPAPDEKLDDETIVRRYQLLRRLERSRLRPGDREVLPRNPKVWRRSPWMRRARERGLLPPGPEWGGELGHEAQGCADRGACRARHPL